jgi:hypothetical protein
MLALIESFLIVVDAVLIGLIVTRTAAQRAVMATGETASRWRAIVKALLAAPPLVLLVVMVLIALVWQTEPIARLTHAILVLGLWMTATVLMFQVVWARRLKQFSPLMSAVGFGLAMMPVIYLTSLDRFQSVFDPIGYGLPLMVGLGLIAETYRALLRLRTAANRQLSAGVTAAHFAIRRGGKS